MIAGFDPFRRDEVAERIAGEVFAAPPTPPDVMALILEQLRQPRSFREPPRHEKPPLQSVNGSDWERVVYDEAEIRRLWGDRWRDWEADKADPVGSVKRLLAVWEAV